MTRINTISTTEFNAYSGKYPVLMKKTCRQNLVVVKTSEIRFHPRPPDSIYKRIGYPDGRFFVDEMSVQTIEFLRRLYGRKSFFQRHLKYK